MRVTLEWGEDDVMRECMTAVDTPLMRGGKGRGVTTCEAGSDWQYNFMSRDMLDGDDMRQKPCW